MPYRAARPPNLRAATPLPLRPQPVASNAMKHRPIRRAVLPLALALASLAMLADTAAAQEVRPKAPVPSKTGTPPMVRTMLLTAVLLGIGIGVNAIPSKRGHQD